MGEYHYATSTANLIIKNQIKKDLLKKYNCDRVESLKLNINYTGSIFIDNNPNELKKFYNSKEKSQQSKRTC